MKASIGQKKILIIGGTGSLGKKLIGRFLDKNHVAVYSRDEAKQWTLKNELSKHDRKNFIEFFVGDIRDPERLKHVIRAFNPSVIVVAAALKQVDTCEMSPNESLSTNVIGTQNVINVINDLDHMSHRTVLFVSTDKACSPVNVYGMCKSLSERLITSQSYWSTRTTYLCVRYGNVLESRGSIIPLFKYQAENESALTVTNPDMTRYVMTLDESVNLIEYAIMNGNSGETFIPQLRSMKIGDLAKIFADAHHKKINVVGLRPGEKMHEDLINESESYRTSKTNDGLYYIIKPSYEKCSTTSRWTYSSNDSVLTLDELKKFLTNLNIIEMPLTAFEGKSIEEIRK